ncbi:hypothetical protein SL057_002409, partial [Flavobacterium psychrophilum]|nr:hypothetical protein [Flavobacterium psychrophilum]
NYTPAYITEFDTLKENLIAQIGISKTRKLEFLKYQVDNYNYEFEVINKQIKPEINNMFPREFVDDFSFKFFERLFDKFKDTKEPLADFSFIYRKMYDENHIHDDVKPESFKKWIAKEPYNIILDLGLKTLDNCKTNSKIIAYNEIKELVKKENTIS